MSFFDFPAEHWKHIRTSNPIESTFATVRLTARDQAAGLKDPTPHDGLQADPDGQDRWRKVNGSHLLPLVRTGVQFTDGEQVEWEDTDERKAAA